MSLFARQPETLDGVEPPTLTREEANLHFTTRVQEDPPSFGFIDDGTWVPIHIAECTVPVDGGFKITFSNAGYQAINDVGHLVQWWRSDSGPTRHPRVEEWLVEHGPTLDKARRYYGVKRHQRNIAEMERLVQTTQESLRRARIRESIDILEIKEGRGFTREERQRLVLEFGGTQEDLQ